jgi:hypothetical protein
MYRCRVQKADSEVAGQQIRLGCTVKRKWFHLVEVMCGREGGVRV